MFVFRLPLKLIIELFLLNTLNLVKFLPYIYLPLFFFSLIFSFTDLDVACCMQDQPSNMNSQPPIAILEQPPKYVICDVKYDRFGEVIRDASGNPEQFCNKHDSQISAMFDRAMSSVEKQQHQSSSLQTAVESKLVKTNQNK